MTAVALTILGGLLDNIWIRIREWRSWYREWIDPVTVTSQKKQSWKNVK